MAMTELGGVVGDWGPDAWGLWDTAGATPNNGPQVQANDVLTNSTVSSGPDEWTGWFQSLIGNVTKYAIQRDAIKSGLVPAQAANGQPVYVPAHAQTATYGATATGGVSAGMLIILGAVGVGLAVLLAQKG